LGGGQSEKVEVTHRGPHPWGQGSTMRKEKKGKPGFSLGAKGARASNGGQKRLCFSSQHTIVMRGAQNYLGNLGVATTLRKEQKKDGKTYPGVFVGKALLGMLVELFVGTGFLGTLRGGLLASGGEIPGWEAGDATRSVGNESFART